MLNVLNTQLYRLKKSKLFWALFIVCAVLPLLGALLISVITLILEKNLSGESAELFVELIGQGGEQTVNALGGLIGLSSDAALFSLICSSIFLSGEFSGGAIRNMVIANKSRTQIFFSFFSVALIIGFSYLGVSYASTLLCYGAVIGFSGMTVAKILSGCFASLFLGIITIALVQSCVCMFLFATRKTGPTVAFPILLILFAPGLMSVIVGIIEVVKVAVSMEAISEVTRSWIPLVNMEMFRATDIDGALIAKIALYNILIAAILAFFSWFAIKKVDLK